MIMKNIYLKIIATLLALMCLLCACHPAENNSDESSEPPETEFTLSSESEETDEPTTDEGTKEPESETTSEPESETETEPISELETQPETEPETQPETEPENPSSDVLVGDQSENENYKDIAVRSIPNYKFISFFTEETDEILCIKVPIDWVIQKVTDSSYSIYREEREIGNLFLGNSTDLSEWQTVATEATDTNGFDMTENIEKYGSGSTLKFRYRYCAKSAQAGASLSVTLTVDYAELSPRATSNILKLTTFNPKSEEFNIGTVPEGKNGSILIIGNSFINTSDIGSILTEMMQKNGKNTEVTAISRAMATIATYISDTTLMREIRNGVYDVVFVCGLYSLDEVPNLKTLKETCDISNTTLVVFPAHNEDTMVIERVSKRIPSLLILNWKGEIDALIADGRDRWDFCEDDTYDHSKPLGGYVGAHMIYRAIHGELPSARLSSSIRQTEVNSVLGDYVRTACSKGALFTLK